MTASKDGTSRCGLCRFYIHEGRRGGRCSQFDVPMNSQWKACCLALSPFDPPTQASPNEMLGITTWTPQRITAEHSLLSNQSVTTATTY
ncbi:MAG: hypothetical protein WBD47_21475 [Phormidesmis sp.]